MMFGINRKPSARLGLWTGPKRSTRSDEPLLPQLRQGPVLARLLVVAVTVVLVTLIAVGLGHPFPYRVGEIYPYDLRVRVDFELFNQVELINHKPQPEPKKPEKPHSIILPETNLLEDKKNDPPIVEKYTRDMVIVPRGEPIRDQQLDLLREEHRAYQRSLSQYEHLTHGIALFLIFSLIAALVVLYVARFQVNLAQTLPATLGVCMLVVSTLVFGLILSLPPWHASLLPLTVTALILALAYNPQFALLMSLSLALAMSSVLGMPFDYLLEMLAGLAAAVLLLRNVRSRTQLVKIATVAAVASLLMTVANRILSGQTLSLVAADALRNFICCTLAGFLLTGLLPQVERWFSVVTDISLLELADGSHPLLQELVRRAPGTYTHSITVATLAEAAAETINANPLLTRVGSYFHDIGKMLKPQYFIENQAGCNLHDSLEPALSTLVIIGHVKDGLALAEEYRLPPPIIDFICEHHGTTLVEYFYREAMRIQEGRGQSCELESSFRYPGPKPQSRESAIVMLADAVESSSRALSDPTPSSLRKLVHDLLMKRLLDGQFEESSLTLTELHLIEESLYKSLSALFHARIKYPEEALPKKAS